MWKIGFWAEKIMSAAILVLQWQGDTFFQVEKFEISRFQTVHGVIKNAISPKVYQPISKNFPSAERMWKIGIWAEKIMSAAILVLQWQGENY